MKVKTTVDGFDGVKSYKVGAILEGNTEHVQRLLFNGLATPLDNEAKDFVKGCKDLDAKAVKEHRLYLPAESETVRVAKKRVKRKW